MAKPGKGDWELFQKRLWTDPAFVELGTEARLLFIWSWTQPKAALCGLYEVSPRQLQRGLGPGMNGSSGAQRLGTALRQLAAKPLVLYDDEAEVLWVVKRAANQNRSPTLATRMRREYEACPDSPLKDRFAEMYGRMLALRAPAGRPSA